MLRLLPDRAEHPDRRCYTVNHRQPRVPQGQPQERRANGAPLWKVGMLVMPAWQPRIAPRTPPPRAGPPATGSRPWREQCAGYVGEAFSSARRSGVRVVPPASCPDCHSADGPGRRLQSTCAGGILEGAAAKSNTGSRPLGPARDQHSTESRQAKPHPKIWGWIETARGRSDRDKSENRGTIREGHKRPAMRVSRSRPLGSGRIEPAPQGAPWRGQMGGNTGGKYRGNQPNLVG
jgi:hypothetical protein